MKKKKTKIKPRKKELRKKKVRRPAGPDLSVRLGGLILKNPVLLASGTSGTGRELAGFLDLDQLGGFITKTLTLKPRSGHPPPRLVETASGLLNAIGWQNPGLEKFLAEELPYLRRFDLPVIASIGGEDIPEYLAVAKALGRQVDALEVNISCPNVEKGGIALGVDPLAIAELTRGLKKTSALPVIIKLSPNVSDIAAMARAAAEGGADALSLINTLRGLALDSQTGKPKLANVFGGLSGPAIKPVALAQVWQAARAVPLPIIGLGGIGSLADALEFLWAGAKAVAIGTASFYEPGLSQQIVTGLKQFLKDRGWPDLDGFAVGSLSKEPD